jgi:hypothetical protein
MPEQSTGKPRRKRLPQRYYPAAEVLKRVYRWKQIQPRRGMRWSLVFRVRALVKLAGISASGDMADDYLDALVAIQERGGLDAPEVQRHAAELEATCVRVEEWHELDRSPAPRAEDGAATCSPADYGGDVWHELGDEWAAFVDEMQDEGEGVDDEE